MLRYLGLVLLLCWHYCLWFQPHVFIDTSLLDDRITFDWLIALAVNGVSVLAIGGIVGHHRHLIHTPSRTWLVTILATATTGLLTLVTPQLTSQIPSFVVAGVLGAVSGWLWLAWGEWHAINRSKFDIGRIGPVFAGALIVSMLICVALPTPASAIFVSLLPAVSGGLLVASFRFEKDQHPLHLLSKREARGGRFVIVFVCCCSFVAAFVSYFAVAIVPWGELWRREDSFTIGVLLAAVAVLVVVGLEKVVRRITTAREDQYSEPMPSDSPVIFRLLPWLLVCDIMACGLLLIGPPAEIGAFMVAMAASSVSEILVTMYMGILMLRGYTSPAVAFSLSAGSILLGICCGDVLSLLYERTPGLSLALERPTLVLFILILAVLLVPLVRMDYRIADLSAEPVQAPALEQVVQRATAEFELSEREAEIMLLLARAWSA
jgi:hypothetical protein